MNAAVAPSRKALLKSELARFGRFMLQELKPKGKVFTPFNIITGGIMLLAAALLAYRFWKGIGSITNLNQDYPWGFWIGFDVVTGVAFAGGAYVVTFMVYILGQEKYHPIVRATVLNGFLAYVFYAGALLLDLGRPWNVVNPIIGNSFGVSSVLFLVAWHFMLYMMAQFVEFSPAVAEWLGWRRVRRAIHESPASIQYARPAPRSISGSPSVAISQSRMARIVAGASGSTIRLSRRKSL